MSRATSISNNLLKKLHEVIDSPYSKDRVSDLLSEADDKFVRLALCTTELPPFGSALHHAAGSGNKETTAVILSTGVDVNIRQVQSPVTQGQTPLHVAALAGSADVVAFLLSRGADANAKESEGFTPLHCACSGNNLDVIRMLVEKSLDINVTDHKGETPLQRSVLRSTSEVSKFLIDNGSDVHVQDVDGQTLLHYAVEWDKAELVELLLKLGIPVDVQDCSGSSPLHLVEDNQAMKDLLLKLGANPDLRNNIGRPAVPRKINAREEFDSLNKVLRKQLTLTEESVPTSPKSKTASTMEKIDLPSIPRVDGAASP